VDASSIRGPLPRHRREWPARFYCGDGLLPAPHATLRPRFYGVRLAIDFKFSSDPGEKSFTMFLPDEPGS
jgi:hypothetical protein